MADPAAVPTAPPVEPEPEDDGASLWAEMEATEAGTEPAAEPEAGTKPVPEPEPEDIWAGASEAQLAAYRSLEHGSRSNVGRISALNRQIAEIRAQQPAAPPASKGNGADPAPPPLPTGKAWETLASDYPEIADAMQAALGESYGQLAAKNTQLERELASLQEHRANNHAYAMEDVLESMSPGWHEFLDEHRESLNTWVSNQPDRKSVV